VQSERNRSLPRRRNRPLKEIMEDPEEFDKESEIIRYAS
jgi:hypothetical protein